MIPRLTTTKTTTAAATLAGWLIVVREDEPLGKCLCRLAFWAFVGASAHLMS